MVFARGVEAKHVVSLPGECLGRDSRRRSRCRADPRGRRIVPEPPGDPLADPCRCAACSCACSGRALGPVGIPPTAPPSRSNIARPRRRAPITSPAARLLTHVAPPPMPSSMSARPPNAGRSVHMRRRRHPSPWKELRWLDIVMKFGGTSVADLDRIRNVAARVKRVRDEGHEIAVVVSAMAGRDQPARRLRARALSLALRRARIRRRGRHRRAGDERACTAIELAGDRRGIGQPVVRRAGKFRCGPTARMASARIEGIEGADLHRAGMAGGPGAGGGGLPGPRDRARPGHHAWAAAVRTPRLSPWPRRINADRCDIYTDVDGIYTTDPRITCKRARKLDKIAYEEMLELASVGAKVLQTRSVELAMKATGSGPGAVERSRTGPGTLVVDEDEIVEKEIVSGIAYSRDEAKITVRGVPDRPGDRGGHLRPAYRTAGVNVDMIVQNVSADSTTDMTFTIGRTDLPRARAIMDEHKSHHRLGQNAVRPGRGQDQRGRRRHAQPHRASPTRCSPHWPPRASTSR